jgi:hypothetical protein
MSLRESGENVLIPQKVSLKVVESQLGGVYSEKMFLGGNPLAESSNAPPVRYTRDIG